MPSVWDSHSELSMPSLAALPVYSTNQLATSTSKLKTSFEISLQFRRNYLSILFPWHELSVLLSNN